MKILVTGGAGFIGSHTAEYFARKGHDVVVTDNLSRPGVEFNWKYLEKFNIEKRKADIRNAKVVEKLARDVDAIIHTAAQVAVTKSLIDPRTDFEINVIGTFNVLEAARKSRKKPTVLFCSTNKVYGGNINKIAVEESKTRYKFTDKRFKNGIPETFQTDICEHTPYGCSKFAADIYVQDYGKRHEIDTGIFRMSCIYGTRQFGNEDQGWVAHFAISTVLERPLTIYGDGKQVRDILFIDDLVNAFKLFLDKKEKLSGRVYNIGGGIGNTISLLELLDILEKSTSKRSKITFDKWRPGDQKVYISDISKARRELGWKPKTDVKKGINKLIGWVKENQSLFNIFASHL